jgi:hypothetical protein
MKRVHLKLIVWWLAMFVVGGCQHTTVAPPAGGVAPPTSVPSATLPAAAEKPSEAAHHLLMIPGEIAGNPSAIVYLIDEDRGLLTAMTYDGRQKQFIYMRGPIDLNRVFVLVAARIHDRNTHVGGMVTGIRYAAATCRIAAGTDGLYVANRDGMIALFVYDPATLFLRLSAAESIMDAFTIHR